jgi:hypothetical protein
VTRPSSRWIQNAATLHKFVLASPDLAAHFFDDPSSFGTGLSPEVYPIQDSFETTPVLRYTSLAQLESDVVQGEIPNPFFPNGSWLLYDVEDWAQTPQGDIDHPWDAMTDFAGVAHDAGLRVIQTPARDLGNNLASANPKLPGETLDAWYLRTGIPAAAARAGDILVVQNQADTKTLTNYQGLFQGAREQAARANAGVMVFTEVSVNYGTPDQAFAAASSVGADGFFMQGANDTASLAWEAQVLTLFQEAGY